MRQRRGGSGRDARHRGQRSGPAAVLVLDAEQRGLPVLGAAELRLGPRQHPVREAYLAPLLDVALLPPASRRAPVRRER